MMILITEYFTMAKVKIDGVAEIKYLYILVPSNPWRTIINNAVEDKTPTSTLNKMDVILVYIETVNNNARYLFTLLSTLIVNFE